MSDDSADYAEIRRGGNAISAIRGDGKSTLNLRSAEGDDISIVLTHEQWETLIPVLIWQGWPIVKRTKGNRR